VSRPTARPRLLEAAAAVARRDGPRALTLDAVAAEAGVSKGGLLYHFPTKDALVEALIDDWLDRFEAEVREGSGGWPRAYARAVGARSATARATDIALMVAVAGGPHELEAIGRRYSDWQERLLAEAPDPVDATIVRLAADGLWMADLFGLAPPTGKLRRAVLERLDELGGA
jgi:AcrR family transcriptional regulator